MRLGLLLPRGGVAAFRAQGSAHGEDFLAGNLKKWNDVENLPNGGMRKLELSFDF